MLNDSPEITKRHDIYLEIDRRLCTLLNVDVDGDAWVSGWYDNIPGMLAFGLSWQKIRETWTDFDDLQKIMDWFEENVTILSITYSPIK